MTIRYRFQALTNKIGVALAIILSTLAITSCNTQGVIVDSEVKSYYDITLEGGTGKAYIESPVTVVTKDEKSYATLIWSSSNYDYIIADGIKYLNENPGGKSTFTIPVDDFDKPLAIIGDTTAMSKPHEIEYVITWNEHTGDAGSAKDSGQTDNAGISDDRRSQLGVRPAGVTPTLSHAKGFDISEHGNCRFISIYGVGDYIIVPEGEDVPEDVPDEITVLKQPLDHTYLVSTSVMDLIRQIGALDMITLSGLDKDDWYIDEAKDRIGTGKIKYAGKYRAPDYELILSEGCNLAIENTMIYHDPEVMEKLEELGIPVMVETSSYEEDPLGRLEWIKLYGVLYGREKEADEWYDEQVKKIGSLDDSGYDNKTVVMFYVSSTGMINARTPGDYLTKMIEMAGGTYVPKAGDVIARGSMGTVSMQTEDFYALAQDADIIVYNSTIDGELSSVSDLTDKNPVFSDLKAVKEGNVYCLRGDFFQRTTGMADLITDFNSVISGSGKEYTFLEKLK